MELHNLIGITSRSHTARWSHRAGMLGIRSICKSPCASESPSRAESGASMNEKRLHTWARRSPYGARAPQGC